MGDVSTPSFAFDRIDPRTRKVTPALIAAITEQIVTAIKPRQVILFGSQAIKNNRSDSDIDLFICLDDNHPLSSHRSHERAGAVLDLFRYRSFGLDIVVLTQGEVKELIESNEGEWDLVIEILEQGKVLYDHSIPAKA